MKPIKITERNIMFSEPMGRYYDLNMGLIRGKRYNYLIDTGLGSGSVAPVLEYLGGDAKPVAVINTHCHWDHIWGNGLFKDSLIIAHPKCREWMDRYWDQALTENGSSVDGEAVKGLPNLLIEGSIYFPEDEIEIFVTPGHSADCISIFDRADKILYAGDNIGDTADEIIPYIETDAKTFRDTLLIYKRYAFETCVSGHNKPQGRDIIPRMEAALDESWKKQVERYGMPKAAE
jgi:glyoxylase-like metal-dependent hydrolase (beta-lactamase superfamily II)